MKPLHWIYGDEAMKSKLANKEAYEKPEFFHPPSCPFYSSELFPGHYGPGQVSPYGEEMLCLVDYMVKSNGEFSSPEGFADALLHWAETFGGRANMYTTQFVESRKAGAKYPKCGADDSQAGSLIKAIVVTARYFGRPELLEKVEQAIRVHQNDDLAVQFGLAIAEILETMILTGQNAREALLRPSPILFTDVKASMDLISTQKEASTSEFLSGVAKQVKLENAPEQATHLPLHVLATSCALPGAFTFAGYFGVKYPGSYEEALRENIRLGGDNCSRAIAIGAILGASGVSVPRDWQAKVAGLTGLEKKIDVIVSHGS